MSAADPQVMERLAAALGRHQPAGWSGQERKPHRCRCGIAYRADEWTAHQAGVLSSLVVGAGLCEDCNGIGHDLCDDCDGTGKRGRGKCRACAGEGTVECPTCDGLGIVTEVMAESVGWTVATVLGEDVARA
jgi:hypothetical protein